MDYSLSFKRITRSDITTDKEVSIQKLPTALLEKDLNTGSLTASSSSGSSSRGGSNSGSGTDSRYTGGSPNFNKAGSDLTQSVVKYFTTGQTPFMAANEALLKSLGVKK
jgi:hypothetical protein